MKHGEKFNKTSLRIAVLAHNLRVAGGLSIGKNVIAALGRVAPEHTYFCTIPEGLGYEEICQKIPRCQTLVHGHKGGFVRRWLFEVFRLPKAIESFRPDLLLGLGILD